MKKIQCQNCGNHVHFTEDLRCDACNIKLYGFNINTLPQEYRQLMEQGGVGGGPAASAPSAPKPKKTTIQDLMPVMFPEVDTPSTQQRPVAESPKTVIHPDHTPTPPPSRRLPEHPGWLIVHTEGKEAIDFELTEGMNYIGRPVEAGQKPHIQVPEDQYVSRGHAVLYISKNPLGKYQYTLTDSESNQRKAPSLNGTYLNGNTERLDLRQSVWLKDGYTVQIGETKLVLKTAEVAPNLEEAKTQVLEMDYEKTVLINA